MNVSIRFDAMPWPSELRHLGWEVPEADIFTSDTECNGIIRERFTVQQQADEIEEAWPGTNDQP